MTTKKPNTKTDTATDLAEIKQLLTQIAKYIRFIGECEAVRQGIEIK